MKKGLLKSLLTLILAAMLLITPAFAELGDAGLSTDTDISIGNNETEPLVEEGETSVLRIYAKGPDSSAINGATFTVLDTNGVVVATVTTGINGGEAGVAETIALPLGNYTVRQTATPTGFKVAADTPVTLPTNTPTTTVNIINQKMPTLTGKLDVTCVSEQFTTYETETNKTLSMKVNTPVWDTQKIEGVKVQVKAAEDIKDASGKIVVAKDALAAEITSDATGVASAIGLTAGKYYVVAISAPAGISVTNTKVNVTINGYEDINAAVASKCTVTCNAIKTEISFAKTILMPDGDTEDMDDNRVYIYNTNGSSESDNKGNWYGIYASETISGAEDSLRANMLVAAAKVKDGTAEFSVDLPDGTYYIKELYIPDCYSTDAKLYKFTVNAEDAKNGVLTIDEDSKGNDLEAECELRYGNLTIRVLDKQGAGVNDVKLSVIDTATDKTVKTLTTEKIDAQPGTAELEDLPYGKYEIKVTSTPTANTGTTASETALVLGGDGEPSKTTVTLNLATTAANPNGTPQTGGEIVVSVSGNPGTGGMQDDDGIALRANGTHLNATTATQTYSASVLIYAALVLAISGVLAILIHSRKTRTHK